jgi:hypothetical protein
LLSLALASTTGKTLLFPNSNWKERDPGAAVFNIESDVCTRLSVSAHQRALDWYRRSLDVKRRVVAYVLFLLTICGVTRGLAIWPLSDLQKDAIPPVVLGQVFSALLTHVGLYLDPGDVLALNVVSAFGAIFGVRSPAVAPPSYIFDDENEVNAFQQHISSREDVLANQTVALQRFAMEQLLAARSEAAKKGLTISPAGEDSSRRTYAITVSLWESRLKPATEHWVAAKRLSQNDAQQLLALEPAQQVREVLRLESEGLFFSKGFDKSILYSVAAPGTSQHLSMLALDVREYANSEVRDILAAHGWFQTVYSDLPHFTFLGRAESDLHSLGLVQRRNAGYVFWVPDSRKTRGATPGEPDIVETCPF